VPDKALQRFREDRKTWLATAARSMKAEAMRGLTERQERVATLDKIVTSQGPTRPGQPATAHVTFLKTHLEIDQLSLSHTATDKSKR
jgi:hypothetical protein